MKPLNLTPHTGDAPFLAGQLRTLAEHLDRVGNIKTLEQSTDAPNSLVDVLSALRLVSHYVEDCAEFLTEQQGTFGLVGGAHDDE